MSRRIRRPAPTQDQRPPEQRLRAVLHEPNPDRALRMFQRIRRDLDADVKPRPWLEAARSLYEQNEIDLDELCYFGEIFTECVLGDPAGDAELHRIGAEMAGIERAHGLAEGESWYISEAPPEWRALNDEWEVRAHEVVAAAFRDAGLVELAEMHVSRAEEFEGRTAVGQQQIFGEVED